jgi:hypothetical protein
MQRAMGVDVKRWQWAPRLLGVLALCAATALPTSAAEPAAEPAADDYWTARDQLDRAFAERLAGLARKCQELGLPAQAQTTAQWFLPRDPHRQYLFLPSEAEPESPAADAPTVVQKWFQRFRQLRDEQADALFQRAESELEAGRAARAYQLLHEVLHENPDHAQARQILGYRQVNGRWRRPEGTLSTRVMNVAQPALGFNAGQHWRAESEHFSVTTNHSQAAAERLARLLENLYAAWQQVFFSYWSNAATLARQFETKPQPARATGRHKVVLFRERQQYVDRLRKLEPQIELSVGIYLERPKTAYFFGDAELPTNNCLHEVTHQLFSETGRVSPPVGMKSNFWIVEGAALYMESLHGWGRFWTVGGQDAHWLQYARYRALREQSHVSLEEFNKLGRQELQQRADISQLYRQAAGLAAFLMDDRRGRYREAMVGWLQAVYQGRDRAETLALLTGVQLPQLDAEYRQFLQVTDADLEFLAALPAARSLLLGHTAVTDAGLQHLAGHANLERLDLGYTQTSDVGFAHLKNATRLNHLILEHTQITDTALDTVRQFRDLAILDLSGNQVTDAGLSRLAGLTKLQELSLAGTRVTDAGLDTVRQFRDLTILHLSGNQVTDAGMTRLAELTKLQELSLAGTQISDAGLVQLRPLKSLTTVDVSQTRVTPAGRKKLKSDLPSLKDD